MVIDNIDNHPVDDLELTEAEFFIKRLFVEGDYKHYADKFHINRDDLKRILYEASIFLGKKNISCSIALILKSVEDSRNIFVSHTGSGISFIINSQAIRILNLEDSPKEIINQPVQPGSLEKPQIFAGKLEKEDTLILCSGSLSAVLDRNFIQRVVISSNGPEEVCKKLLHSASEAGRKDNISVSAFNGSGTKRIPNKKRISNKTLLLIIIPLFLVLIGLLIIKLSPGTKVKPVETSPTDTFETIKLPPVIEKDTIVQTVGLDTPISIDKNLGKKAKDIVQKFGSVNFTVNGSVVMISNWESVKPEILNINWDNGITDKKRIHKYTDYTSIPSSVKVTYKDFSTRSFKIK